MVEIAAAAPVAVTVEPESTPAAVPVERPRAANGKFVSKDKPIDRVGRAREAMKAYYQSGAETRLGDLTGAEQTPDAKAKADAPEVKPEEPEEEIDTEAVEAGIESLKRFKVPAKLIEAMSKAELATYGAQAQKEIAANAELSRELGELRKAAKQTAPTKAASEKSEQPVFDVDAFKAKVATALDEEAVDALVNSHKSLHAEIAALKSALNERDERINAELGPIKSERAATMVEKARAGLEERFPQVSDKKFFASKVLPRMAQLNRPDEKGERPYSDVNELMLHALRIEAGEKQKSQSPAPSPRKPASPLSSDTSRPRPRPMDIREKARTAWTLAKAGKSDAEIEAAVRGTA